MADCVSDASLDAQQISKQDQGLISESPTRDLSKTTVEQSGSRSRAISNEDELLMQLDDVLQTGSLAPEAFVQQSDYESNHSSNGSKFDNANNFSGHSDGDCPNGASFTSDEVPNGLQTNSGVQINMDKISKLYEAYSRQQLEIERLEKTSQDLRDRVVILLKEKDVYSAEINELKNSNAAKVTELERRLLDQEYQNKTLKDRFQALESQSKKALNDIRKKHENDIEGLKKTAENATREKDSAVIRYAQREKEMLDLKKSQDEALTSMQHMKLERDALNNRLRASKSEKDALSLLINQKENEIFDLKREVQRIQSYLAEADVRVKVAAKRVEDVEATHNETKSELEKTHKRLVEAKEETETIRLNCKDLIRKYQESEEMRSSQLGVELKTKLEELKVHRQEHRDQEEVFKQMCGELDALKIQHKALLGEIEKLNCSLKEKTESLSLTENSFAEEKLRTSNFQQQVSNLENEIERLRKKEQELIELQSRCHEFEQTASNAVEEAEDAKRDSRCCQQQAEELLLLNQQLSEKATILQTENDSLNVKVFSLEKDIAECQNDSCALKTELTSINAEYASTKDLLQNEVTKLRMELDNKIKQEQQLLQRIDDAENQAQVVKRKNLAAIKELKSEIASLKRKLEAYETAGSQCSGDGETADQPTSRQHSRSSSISSLDAIARQRQIQSSKSPSIIDGAGVNGEQSENSLLSTVNQKMVEKIVKLQRMLARRNEKIEFLEEHMKQLVSELQGKSHLIQHYALREECGLLAPPNLDQNKLLDLAEKVELSRKGQSIMASMFSSHNQDGRMTLELASEINQKLQAVLEDSLLKNLTLKENLETLGKEISRLTSENRELKNSRKI